MENANSSRDEPVSSNKLGGQICQALGIPVTNVLSLSLELVAGEPAVLHVRVLPPGWAFDQMREVLAQSYLIAPLQGIDSAKGRDVKINPSRGPAGVQERPAPAAKVPQHPLAGTSVPEVDPAQTPPTLVLREENAALRRVLTGQPR